MSASKKEEDSPPVEKSQQESSHRTFTEFLDCVRHCSVDERRAALKGPNAWMAEPVSPFQELFTVEGKEPLKYIWDHFADFKEKGLETIQACLAEHLNSKRNSRLIANAVRSCMLEHSEELESDDGRAEGVQQETSDPQEETPETTAESEGHESEPQEVGLMKPSTEVEDGGTPQQEPKFRPNSFGGKELCIVVSYNKANKHDLKKLAKTLTHKGKIEYVDYNDAEDWRRRNPETFKNHLAKLRRKAKDKGWWDAIPPSYYLSYT